MNCCTLLEFISHDYFPIVYCHFMLSASRMLMVNPEILCICNAMPWYEWNTKTKAKHSSLIFQSGEHCWCLTSVKENTFVFFKISYIFILTVDWLLLLDLVASGRCPSLSVTVPFTSLGSHLNIEEEEQLEVFLKLSQKISVNMKNCGQSH